MRHAAHIYFYQQLYWGVTKGLTRIFLYQVEENSGFIYLKNKGGQVYLLWKRMVHK
ncbi:hypothetical protein TEH_04270 [Tetragenococcus halophilus NBRC 12172]|uniref:Uncharacterized protein n=1 Tax=Tetragenococcus halophilus (strain DSM 20338 / JCM 20259 / NCIMB 9735 / NBRC 12172) TaxID=945021 RepID=A0AAN1VQ86_TETHN|nr:hypothetical protein TEH_04270 [Tetragenococcus halophilus NBRC 12172]